ncbi:MAG: hypothetical protein AAF528_04150 [Cyanobacteria bacterium P01_C01_bin.121]
MQTRSILWLLLAISCCTELGISGAKAGFFRADVVMHNLGLWTDSARQALTENVDGR